MNDKECSRTYRRLVEIVDKFQLDWIVAEVAEEIRLGKSTQREIETLKGRRDRPYSISDAGDTDWLRKGPRATYPVTVEYSTCEQLGLLIDAIEQAVVNTAFMENELVRSLTLDNQSLGRIEFQAEDESDPSRTVDERTVEQRLELAQQLLDVLGKFREELRK